MTPLAQLLSVVRGLLAVGVDAEKVQAARGVTGPLCGFEVERVTQATKGQKLDPKTSVPFSLFSCPTLGAYARSDACPKLMRERGDPSGGLYFFGVHALGR